jgi:hypothetical protein
MQRRIMQPAWQWQVTFWHKRSGPGWLAYMATMCKIQYKVSLFLIVPSKWGTFYYVAYYMDPSIDHQNGNQPGAPSPAIKWPVNKSTPSFPLYWGHRKKPQGPHLLRTVLISPLVHIPFPFCSQQ